MGRRDYELPPAYLDYNDDDDNEDNDYDNNNDNDNNNNNDSEYYNVFGITSS